MNFLQAWEYSTFLFCGLNLAAFLFILFAYISMFFTISHSKIGLRSTQQLQDRTIAKRFAFIVGTDFLCWVPIVLIKVIAMSGMYLICSFNLDFYLKHDNCLCIFSDHFQVSILANLHPFMFGLKIRLI